MRDNDRKLVWAALLVFVVIGVALIWLAFIGPAKGYSGYTSQCERNCNEPWWWSGTFWSLILSGLLVGANILLWWSAKDAAGIARSALVDLERPFVYAEITKPGIFVHTSDSDNPRIVRLRECELSLINFGRTPASLMRLEYVFRDIPKGETPKPIDPHEIGGRELPIGTISADKYPFRESTNLAQALIGTSNDIAKDRVSVWVIGFVRYQDIFGQNYITGFAKVYDPIGDRFIARGDQQYNYAHQEDPENIPGPSSNG